MSRRKNEQSKILIVLTNLAVYTEIHSVVVYPSSSVNTRGKCKQKKNRNKTNGNNALSIKQRKKNIYSHMLLLLLLTVYKVFRSSVPFIHMYTCISLLDILPLLFRFFFFFFFFLFSIRSNVMRASRK